MELNNIIYDKDALASALIEQWNNESETFKAMYPSDTAVSLANIMAGYGAMLQYILVSAMANCYTDTAYTEMGVYQLAQTLGNTLHGNNSAQVQVSITKNNFIGVHTNIPANTQFIIDNKKFFNPHEIILPAVTKEVHDIVLMQGEIITVSKLSTGIPNERFYFSSDFKASNQFITVKVNDEVWDVQESLLEYDKNFVLNLESLKTVVLRTDPDGRAYIRFGDGQFGNLPPADSVVEITYISNEGSGGNIAETGKEGELDTQLVFTDNYGKQENLDVSVITTTTAYGGFDKQSLETLRQTSPWIFASGHRAIRRQDYNAILQNKCGYLSTKTWGEYEQSNLVGAYDSLMNNMVYYSGVKSFQTYPYFAIGGVDAPDIYQGTIGSERGFYGSHDLKITNAKKSSNTIHIQDNMGKGLLFVNDDTQDPRDGLFIDWVKTEKPVPGVVTKSGYEMILPGADDFVYDECIRARGTGYQVGDLIVLNNTNNEIVIRVNAIDTTDNSVTAINFAQIPGEDNLRNIASEDWTNGEEDSIFTTKYYGSTTGNGSGLKVTIRDSGIYKSDLIWTNDRETADGSTPPVQYHPISHARSDALDTQYYQSLKEPSLLQPVQIRIHYNFTDCEEYIGKREEAIAAIKFKAMPSNAGPFIGSMAVFGCDDDAPSFENIRNNEHWHKLLNRTRLTNPYGNNNNNWTDWIPLNTLEYDEQSGKIVFDNLGKPVFKTYKFYVIEFYSTENSNITANHHITFSKIKLLYGKDASTLSYNDNGKIYLNLPYWSTTKVKTKKVTGFPEEWGNIVNIKQGVTNNETHNSWKTAVLLFFSNNYILPVIFDNNSSRMYFDEEQVIHDSSTMYNNAVWDKTLRVWKPCVASDKPNQMVWSLNSKEKANADYGEARKCNWDKGYTIDGHPSVFTSRFNIETSSGEVTGNIYDTYYKNTKISFSNEMTVFETNHFSLLGTDDFSFYNYDIETSGITRDNGYRNGNLLTYVYQPEALKYDPLSFYVYVNDIDNGIFEYSLNYDKTLTGNTNMNSANDLSLDDTLVYSISGSQILNKGTGYDVDDEFVLTGYNYEIGLLNNGDVYVASDESKTSIGKLDIDQQAIVRNDVVVSAITGYKSAGALKSLLGYNNYGQLVGCVIMTSVGANGARSVYAKDGSRYGYWNPDDNKIYAECTANTQLLKILVTDVNSDGSILEYTLLQREGDVDLTQETQVYIQGTNTTGDDRAYFSFECTANSSGNKYSYNLLGNLSPTVTGFQRGTEYVVYRYNGFNISIRNLTFSTQLGYVEEATDRYYVSEGENSSKFLGFAVNYEKGYLYEDETLENIIGYYKPETISGSSSGFGTQSVVGDHAVYTNLIAYHESDEPFTDMLGNVLRGKVTSTDSARVRSFVWLSSDMLGVNIVSGNFTTKSVNGSGTGLTINVTGTCRSGINNVPGSGAKITIKSNNNLPLDCTFTGNRIDTRETNRFDQPIIEKYNHFTTFLEFQQPLVVQMGITASVSLNTSANVTSAMIIQEIKNNIYKLFEITPTYIGKGIKISDIYTAVMRTPNVNWCKINYPSGHVEVDEYSILVCNYIDIVEDES